MLKTKEGRISGPIPRWGRALGVALLAAAVVGVSALRCPAQKAGEPVYAVAFIDGGTAVEKDAAPAAPEPFDLSYLPPDAMGVACFRPSAVLGRPGLKKYADAANKAIAEECKALELPRAFGLRVEEIAQVALPFSVQTDKKAKGPQSALMTGTPVILRATKDFDWAAEIKALLPGVKEVRHGDRVIYQFPAEGPLAPMFGPMKMCCYAPDGRTVVFDTEERLGRLIDRKPGDAPAWAADFKRVERGLGAVVLDNRNGAWARELSARDNPEPAVAPFLDHTPWVVFGVSEDEGLTCEAVGRFDGEEIAAKAMKGINGWLSGARTALATSPDDASYSFLKSLFEKPELKREGASVRLRCHVDGDATGWLEGILDEQVGMGPKP